MIYREQSEYDQAVQLHEEALAHYTSSANTWGMAMSYSHLGVVAYFQNHADQAEQYHYTALEMRKILNDELGIASSLNNLGAIAFFCK